MRLWLDLETYSATPISYGTYRYAADADITLFAYAIDDETPKVIEMHTDGARTKVQRLLDQATEIWAHNAMFDRSVLNANGFKNDLSKWRCTRIMAYTNGIGGSLANVCEFLGIPADKAKDKDGRDDMLFFCKPDKNRNRPTKQTHPERWARYVAYAGQDITAMRECHKRLMSDVFPSSQELDFYHLDQKINDRGFFVDIPLTTGAIDVIEKEKTRLAKETKAATSGAVEKATQRDALLKYLEEQHGVILPDLRKDTVRRALNNDDLSDEARHLLSLRVQAGAASLSKFAALLRATNTDRRCRGTIQHYGARTGRASGVNFQPQNIPSRGLLPGRICKYGADLVRHGCYAPFLYENTSHFLVSILRWAIAAPPGHKIVAGDLSNIEGRAAAFVSEDDVKLQAYLDFDRGAGDDLYNIAYARAFNVDVNSVSKEQRAIGKVMELFLQYQGGVPAFTLGAQAYNFDIEDMAEQVWDTFPLHIKEESDSFLDWWIEQGKDTLGLSRKAFIACDSIKRLWRNSNAKIVTLWAALENNAHWALEEKGSVKQINNHLSMIYEHDGLSLVLPSGRKLRYPKFQWTQNKSGKRSMTYYNHRYKGMTSIRGGKFLENVCQALSRDILYTAMQRAEGAGFKIIMHVHDEIVAEVDKDSNLGINTLCEILTQPVDWAKSLPLAAAGYEGEHYKK